MHLAGCTLQPQHHQRKGSAAAGLPVPRLGTAAALKSDTSLETHGRVSRRKFVVVSIQDQRIGLQQQRNGGRQVCGQGQKRCFGGRVWANLCCFSARFEDGKRGNLAGDMSVGRGVGSLWEGMALKPGWPSSPPSAWAFISWLILTQQLVLLQLSVNLWL